MKGHKEERKGRRSSRSKISNKIDDLKIFNIQEPIINAWRENFKNGLNKLQLQAVNDKRLLDGKSLLIVAPTSSGKTFIGEMAAVRAINEGRKAISLFPYRALVNEKFDYFENLYGNDLHIRVIRCSGDYLDNTGEFVKGKFDLAILTFEMFLSLTLRKSFILNRIGLIVLDEAQFISDENRGIVVELILTKLRSERNKGINPQLILLSAAIGSINHFDKWLDIETLITKERPVPLEIGVLDRNGEYEYLNSRGKRKRTQLLPADEIFQRGRKPSPQDILIPLVKKILMNKEKKEKILVFRNQKWAAESCASDLARNLYLSRNTAISKLLPKHDRSSISFTLEETLRNGAAFHNSNLSREERNIIEKNFRDPKGEIQILAATSTVAAGINTPASTVIIVEHSYPWENRQFMRAEVKNMAGRAGRLGFRETGRAIILAETPYERTRLFKDYILGKPEPIRSSFNFEEIGTWVLRLLTQVENLEQDEITQLILNTFGGFLKRIEDSKWEMKAKEELNSIIPIMKEYELIKIQGSSIKLSLLGRVCGESSISFDSVLVFLDLLKKSDIPLLNHLQLMAVVQILPELDSVYTPLYKKGFSENQWPKQLAEKLGEETCNILNFNTNDIWNYYARAKRVCALIEWVNGVGMSEIEKKFTLNSYSSFGPGNTRQEMEPLFAAVAHGCRAGLQKEEKKALVL